MLEKMRTHSRNWLISLLFGAIIVVFAINFGPGFDQLNQTGCLSQQGYAAKVNGEAIPRQVFAMQWRNYLRSRQIPEQFIRSLNLKQRLMDELVNEVLLSQAARRYGLQISDEEVQEKILENPDFQSKDKIFDLDRFRRVVNNYYGITTDLYQEQLRTSMQATRMRQMLTAGVRVSDEEVRRSYEENNTKAKIAYLSLDRQALKLPVEIKAAEVDAFLKTKEADEKLKPLFEKKKDQYVERVRASHILYKLTPAEAKDPKVLAEKTKKLEGFREEALKTPARFAELAKQNSDCPSKVRGGDLDFFTFKMMDPAFSKAAFALKKKNDISPVVQSRFGLHIIQLTDRKPERDLKDQKLRKELADEFLRSERAAQAVKQFAEGLLVQAKAGKSLEDIAALYKKKDTKAPASQPSSQAAAASKPAIPYYDQLAGKLSVKSPAAFTRFPENIPGLGKIEECKEIVLAAFQLQEKQLAPRVFTSGNQIVLFQVRKRLSPDMKEYEKEKEQLRERMLNRKKANLEQVWLESIRKQVSIDENKSLLSYDPEKN